MRRLAEWLADLKLAGRTLRRSPGFTGAAILVLALGIGANAAIFSAVKATLLAPPPFPDPQRLVVLNLTDSSTTDPGPARSFIWSYPKYRVMAETEGRLADPVAAYARRTLTLTGQGDATVVTTELVTPDYLDVLGITPMLGRDFAASDDVDGAPPTVLLSHGIWQDRFGADPGVVGRSVTLNGRAATVIGVAPAGFRGLTGQARMWAPIHTGAQLITPILVRGAQAHWLLAIGRLRPGATATAMDEQMHAIGRTIAETYPDSDPTVIRGGNAESLMEARVNPQARRSLLVLSAAAALLLLVACGNLAGLLVARASARVRETAVRVALGAGRWRVARTLLTESVLLAALGGAAAMLVARFGTDALVAAWPARFLDGGWNLRFADLDRIRVDGWVLAFTGALALAAGILFGAVPALSALRVRPGRALREGAAGAVGGRSTWDVRSALVAGEMALALVLLVGAGLLLRSLGQLNAVDRGYTPGNLVTFDVSLPSTSRWADDRAGFYEDYLNRLRGIPGVESAAMGCVAPVSGHCMITGVREAGDRSWPEGSRPAIGVHYVSDGFFSTLGIPVLEGRDFGPQDQRDSPPVIVLSQEAARQLFPDGGALGRRVAMGTELTSDEGSYAQVVGIVGDVLFDRPENGIMPEAFISHRQEDGYGTFFLRTRGEPMAAVPAARAALAEIDPDVPLASVETLDQVEAGASAETRSLGGLLAVFAALALIMACTGVWAVVAYAVSRRTRELGLRVALGAEPGQVVGLVMRKGLTLALAGAALGGLGAWAATRLLRSLLYDVAPSDPTAFVGGVAALLLVAGLAAWIPARRATRLDPMEALRAD